MLRTSVKDYCRHRRERDNAVFRSVLVVYNYDVVAEEATDSSVALVLCCCPAAYLRYSFYGGVKT